MKISPPDMSPKFKNYGFYLTSLFFRKNILTVIQLEITHYMMWEKKRSHKWRDWRNVLLVLPTLVFQTIYQLQVIEAHQLRGFNVSFKIQSRFQESIVDILYLIEELDNIHYCLTSIIMVPKIMDKLCHSIWRHRC